MQVPPGTIARPRERLLVSVAGLLLAILMTWPLAAGLGHLGRTDPNDADGQYSIWNVAWVAHTIVADPLDLFDANIFAPHKRTLAYSEANILPGAIGAVPWWLTRNPWLTLNVVLLAAFASAFVCTYLLLLYLGGSRAAAAAGGVIYAFCPYVMSHLSHIQLLFTGGIPLALYLVHRLVDEAALSFRLKAETTEEAGVASAETGVASAETAVASAETAVASEETAVASEETPVVSAFRRNDDAAVRPNRDLRNRGILLGLALAAQALSCAYYGVFAGLIVGYATLVLAAVRGLWKSVEYWKAIAIGAATSLALTMPFFVPFLRVQQETGFARTVEDTARWAARWPIDYLVSPAHAHAALLAYARTLGPYLEVLFPGAVAIVFGLAGIFVALRRGPASAGDRGRDRETALLYGTLGVLALWSSLGPQAGLYRVLYYLPTFSFLRAPSRLGLVVTLALVVFATLAWRALLKASPSRVRPAIAAIAVLAAIADVAVFPLRWVQAPSIPDGYDTLTRRTRATIAEFPFYGDRVAFPMHAQFMLFSTRHWLPMVNGYSDVIPADFREAAPVLAAFPSREAFAVLARRRVRYIVVHWDMYVNRKDEIRQRLEPYLPNLQALAGDERMTVYEVLKYP